MYAAPHPVKQPGTHAPLFSKAAPLFAALVALAAHWPVLAADFVNFDDPTYVLGNPIITKGLGPMAALRFAATAVHGHNWHPVTWMSHYLDHALWGFNPFGHHLTNLLLHATAAALLVRLWIVAGLAAGPSLFCGLLLALHPIHVESVAWVAERKDLLCAVFWLATCILYVRAKRANPKAVAWIALPTCALALASKPTAVTLPCALALLDVWPLNLEPRDKGFFGRILARLPDKAPFFVLAVAVSVVTIHAQEAKTPFLVLSPLIRFANAVLSYGRYLADLVFPYGLSPIYLHPGDALSPFSVGAMLLALTLLTLLAHRRFRDNPALLVGLVWFLGVLVPSAGFIQVGFQARADRYAYIPFMGLYAALAFGLLDRASNKALVRVGALAAFCALFLLTQRQIGHWKDSEALYSRVVAVEPHNWPGWFYLSRSVQHDPERMEEAWRRAAALSPEGLAGLHLSIARAEMGFGDPAKALPEFDFALSLKPENPIIWNTAGALALRLGDADGAVRRFAKAVELSPENPVYRANLDAARAAAALKAPRSELNAPDRTNAASR